MAGILDQIGADPGATPAPSAEPAPAASPSPDKPMLIVRGIASGQLPGAYVPKGAPEGTVGMSPEEMTSVGVSFYRPQSPDVALVMFNAERVPLAKIQALDKEGRITETLPSTEDLLGGPTGTPETPVDEATPAPEQPDAVPVLPRPTFGPQAQQQVARGRVAALGGGSEPSKRLIPGGGAILNSLITRAV